MIPGFQNLYPGSLSQSSRLQPLSQMKLKLRVAVISATSAFDPKKITAPPTTGAKRDASTLQQTCAPFVHRQFLLLVPNDCTFSDLKPLLRTHYYKLYSAEPNFVPLKRVIKFRDELQCDLDDDFAVSEICDSGALIFAVSDLDFHNCKKAKVASSVPPFKEEKALKQEEKIKKVDKDERKVVIADNPVERVKMPVDSPVVKSVEITTVDSSDVTIGTVKPVTFVKPVTANVTVSVTDNVKASVTDNVKANVTDNVKASVTDNVKANVTDNVKAHVTDNFKAKVTDHFKAKVIDNVTANVAAQIESSVVQMDNPSVTPCPSPSTTFVPRKSSSFEESSSSSEEVEEENSIFGFILPSIVVAQPKRSEVSILFAVDSSSCSDEEDSATETLRKDSPVPDPSVIPSLAEVVESVNRAPTPARRGRPKKPE
jgi:hypothetical protein